MYLLVFFLQWVLKSTERNIIYLIYEILILSFVDTKGI